MRAITASSMDCIWINAILRSFLKCAKKFCYYIREKSIQCEIIIKPFDVNTNLAKKIATYGKNLNAFTVNPALVNASLIASSVSCCLEIER